MQYKQIFLGQDGNKILSGLADNFSKYFDWQIVLLGSTLFVHKNTQNPKTIYLKTDFLPEFVNLILPQINNKFILITACSDFSPEVNFKTFNFRKAYKTLIEDSRLKFWFMNNMRTKTEKSFSLPVGLGAGKFWKGCTEKEVDDIILNARSLVKDDEKIKDKIF